MGSQADIPEDRIWNPEKTEQAAQVLSKMAGADARAATYDTDPVRTTIQDLTKLLHERMGALEQTIEELRSLLHPVLTKTEPEAQDEVYPKVAPFEPIRSDLAAEVASAIAYVDQLRARTQELKERVEL